MQSISVRLQVDNARAQLKIVSYRLDRGGEEETLFMFIKVDEFERVQLRDVNRAIRVIFEMHYWPMKNQVIEQRTTRRILPEHNYSYCFSQLNLQ